MKNCQAFKRKIVDYIEDQLTEYEHEEFKEHLQRCKQCQTEYSKVKKLYEVLDNDTVILPEQAFFDSLKIKLRQKNWVPRKSYIKRIIKILVPVFAAAIIVLLLNQPDKTVEMRVSVSVLLEDEEIAVLGLSGVINEELIDELSVVEEYLSFEVDVTIDELSEEEQAEFIKNLYEKYNIDA